VSARVVQQALRGPPGDIGAEGGRRQVGHLAHRQPGQLQHGHVALARLVGQTGRPVLARPGHHDRQHLVGPHSAQHKGQCERRRAVYPLQIVEHERHGRAGLQCAEQLQQLRPHRGRAGPGWRPSRPAHPCDELPDHAVVVGRLGPVGGGRHGREVGCRREKPTDQGGLADAGLAEYPRELWVAEPNLGRELVQHGKLRDPSHKTSGVPDHLPDRSRQVRRCEPVHHKVHLFVGCSSRPSSTE
jgi:hypothetical protein